MGGIKPFELDEDHPLCQLSEDDFLLGFKGRGQIIGKNTYNDDLQKRLSELENKEKNNTLTDVDRWFLNNVLRNNEQTN
tara:strand:+ start:151 stop:387 length:237 start_codon:yes stop_codon:yes gene_type:complete